MLNLRNIYVNCHSILDICREGEAEGNCSWALGWGSPCHMSILRNDNFACLHSLLSPCYTGVGGGREGGGGGSLWGGMGGGGGDWEGEAEAL